MAPRKRGRVNAAAGCAHLLAEAACRTCLSGGVNTYLRARGLATDYDWAHYESCRLRAAADMRTPSGTAHRGSVAGRPHSPGGCKRHDKADHFCTALRRHLDHFRVQIQAL